MVRYELPSTEEAEEVERVERAKEAKWYPGSCLVKFRTEEIYECNKEYGKVTVVRRKYE